MAVITVPYKILAKGYKLSGGRTAPTKATVPYLVAWSDAFLFYDQVLGYTSATVVGPITYHIGHQFPPAPHLYAMTADIEPCGVNGAPLDGVNQGLSPGEFFKYAMVTVSYETPQMSQQPGDDPGNLQQFDPSNPITLCEQELETGGKMITVKGEGLEFPDMKPVTGDQVVVVAETRLVLTFPRVPFLPWQLTKKYVGRVNDAAILGCDRGCLLFESQRTKFTETSLGLAGKQLQLVFCHQDEDWNMGIRPDGSHALMRWKSDHSTTNYKYINFFALFQNLVFNAA